MKFHGRENKSVKYLYFMVVHKNEEIIQYFLLSL